MSAVEDDTEDTPYSFGEYIKLLRLQKHYSLTKAAKMMEMRVQRLCDIESGRRSNRAIPLRLVQLISTAYGVSIAEIIKNTQKAVTTDKTTTDILRELIPAARLAELLAERLQAELKTFPEHLGELSAELRRHNNKIFVLGALLQKKHFIGTESPVFEEV